jgi:hypothetical protein
VTTQHDCFVIAGQLMSCVVTYTIAKASKNQIIAKSQLTATFISHPPTTTPLLIHRLVGAPILFIVSSALHQRFDLNFTIIIFWVSTYQTL